jgi:hypothetical protein
LTKIYVRDFYAENASFFLFVIGIGAGFMSSVEHIALAQFFISSPLLLLIPILVWAFYTVKILNFNQALSARGENRFLLNLILLPKVTQRILIASVVISQLLPAILYGLFLISQAAQYSFAYSVAAIALTLITFAFVLGFRLVSILRYPEQEKKIWALTRFVNNAIKRPYPFYSVEWISRRYPGMFISSKTFSIALLFGVLRLYSTDTYDARLLSMALLIISASNAQLVFEIHMFENVHFALVRQLPFSFIRRIFTTLASVFIIFFVEICFLISGFPSDLSTINMIESVLLICTFPVFIYGLLFLKSVDQEGLMRIIFIVTIALFVLVLFKVPSFAISLVNFTIGIILWIRNYYTFEYHPAPIK